MWINLNLISPSLKRFIVLGCFINNSSSRLQLLLQNSLSISFEVVDSGTSDDFSMYRFFYEYIQHFL